jgi:hypothetical protein
VGTPPWHPTPAAGVGTPPKSMAGARHTFMVREQIWQSKKRTRRSLSASESGIRAGSGGEVVLAEP